MIKYIDISGFNLNEPNRGNAALSYGALAFLEERGYLKEDMELIFFHPYNNFLKRQNVKVQCEIFKVGGKTYKRRIVPIHKVEYFLVRYLGVVLPFTFFGRYVKQVVLEAADYGGDGFSDIYGKQTFLYRMNQTWILRRAGVPLLLLPQTIGPFTDEKCKTTAVAVMRYAKEIYVRDGQFIHELEKLGLKYIMAKDISSMMIPEPWDIEIMPKAVGLNISGLAYSNTFKGLEGQFDAYPDLIEKIIMHFQKKGCAIYLIPHSYGYTEPTPDDDLIACRSAYNRLKHKTNVVLIDRDLTAPQLKFIISQMTFFIGARMHANFAAIYTGVPVFGTAYSYKFYGAFNQNGLDGERQTAMINNLNMEEIPKIVEKIDNFYNNAVQKV